jgi:hypothetical protein
VQIGLEWWLFAVALGTSMLGGVLLLIISISFFVGTR